MKLTALLLLLLSTTVFTLAADDDDRRDRKEINISTGKRLIIPAPGAPRSTNSLPMTMALSPDKKWLAILNAGYGTKESGYKQSIAILNTDTDELRDFPDDRLGQKTTQSYFLGLAWSENGRHIYASIGSTTDPEAKGKDSTGNGIAVYTFADGAITPERFIKIPMQAAPAGKRLTLVDDGWPAGKAVCFPAGIAVPSRRIVGGDHERLVVACNLSDAVLVLNADTGAIEHAFDVSQSDTIPGAYPYAVVTSDDGRQAWVSLWNSSRVVELHIDTPQSIVRTISIRRPKEAQRTGSHPTALTLAAPWLYVTLANTDEVAVIDVTSGKVKKTLSTRIPEQHEHGAYPSAIALSGYPNNRLFVANSAANSVADVSTTATYGALSCPDKCVTRSKDRFAPKPRFMQMEAEGFIPTEWYPTALALKDDYLYIATAKGRGQGPNSAKTSDAGSHKGHPYIATLMHGSLAKVRLSAAEKDMHALTDEVVHANRNDEQRERLQFAGGKNPIKHVIYIIKENRTYDQLFGDIAGANGDESLTLFGEQITPNHHALARQFGVLDNFYDSGEVSGSGHVWSNAATTSDYTERTWQIVYRGERTYDYEGEVGGAIPLDKGIPDVNEPATGYLWTNAARHKLTYRQYGEYVTSNWCAPENNEPFVASAACPKQAVLKGEPLNGAPSPWPWPVPLLKNNVATKPELRDHFAPNFANFRMDYPDQLRADEFIREFNGYVKARAAGNDTLPRLIVLRLPNDHTAGTRVGLPTPAATVADNDLALGRIVEAVSHSAYWDDTAIFALEDDAQDGADHVDAHRSIMLVISKYSPHGRCAPDQPASMLCSFVDSRFYTTVSTIATIEALLGLPPMNNNDAHTTLMSPLFNGPGDQAPFKADHRNSNNGLLFETNKKNAPGASASAEMDFSHADAADTTVLNSVIWQSVKGDVPMPEPVHNIFGRD